MIEIRTGCSKCNISITSTVSGRDCIPNVPSEERMRLEADKDVSESYWKRIAQLSLLLLAIVSALFIIELIR